ncbi:hypothetical protein AAFF_G00188000 [Aldrovandia affinis]|uniref:Uncharacterized protein n=1 Tax=Aldrovandia affinis TaxID=143900 RepID=A0AAD7SY69_9TELE|nr:hypothetical protein AAFF_G00188000 [Aldrovandia affinis]
MSLPDQPEGLDADMGPDMESFQLERPPSPARSYLSMESDVEQPVKAEGDLTTPIRVHERAESPEMRQSETSHEQPREGAFPPEQGPDAAHQPFPPHAVSESEGTAVENLSPMEMPFIFKSIQRTLEKLTEAEFILFKKYLSYSRPEDFASLMVDLDVLDVVDRMLERCGKGGAVKVSLDILTSMKKNNLARSLEGMCKRIKVQYELRIDLKRRHESIFEGIPQQGQHSMLHSIYTEVHMTEGNAGVNKEHEVRQSEMASGRLFSPEILLKSSELFESSFICERGIRTVMTRGIPGIGLTVTVQKFVMDWTEERSNQDIQFVFPLPFRELKYVDTEMSLIDLLCYFYPALKGIDFIESPDCKVLFILEGLDEYLQPLSFRTNELWHDVKAPTSVDMLVTNLIKGRLVPSGLVWITSRQAATSVIPADCVDLLTQMRGFTDLQKEEYFRKKINDQELASKIVEYVQSSRSLHIICHVPMFCWVVAAVFKTKFPEADSGETPMTVTQLFLQYVLVQSTIRKSKYIGFQPDAPKWTDDDRDFLVKLGKLAFRHLEKDRKEFYLADIQECGLDAEHVTVQSGLCTEHFPAVHTVSQQRVFCFVHLSIQEFLAAFYVYVSFRLNHRNVLDHAPAIPRLFKEAPIVDLNKSAIDKALQSKNGHLDLFLRFLLGLSVEFSQYLLEGLLPRAANNAHSVEETVKYIRKKMRENTYPDRCSNLRICLADLEA